LTSLHSIILLFALAACQKPLEPVKEPDVIAEPVDTSKQIREYVPVSGWCICLPDSSEKILLRKFKRQGHTYYFTVDPLTIETSITCSDSIIPYAANWESLRSRYANAAYIRVLQKAGLNCENLKDAGFSHLETSKNGIYLTIDLCPSHLPLDRVVFTDLIHEVGSVENPIPLAISVSGKWMSTHSDDLNWLDSLDKSGLLSIIWINHSFNHFIKKDVPLNKNFLLKQGTDVYAEVTNIEIALLGKGIIPSAFFRFPGLISDPEIFKKVTELGLIPVGSDAWLAKGQRPGNGSIVLIHANGNEPRGVRILFRLLAAKHAEVLSKRWKLLDLRESMVEDESK
jgi:hypothetical protein